MTEQKYMMFIYDEEGEDNYCKRPIFKYFEYLSQKEVLDKYYELKKQTWKDYEIIIIEQSKYIDINLLKEIDNQIKEERIKEQWEIKQKEVEEKIYKEKEQLKRLIKKYGVIT